MKSLSSRRYLLNESSSLTALDKPIHVVTWIYFSTMCVVLLVMALLIVFYFS